MNSSHAKTIFIVTLTCCLLIPRAAEGRKPAGTNTAENAAQAVISTYRTNNPVVRVEEWQREITHPSGNPKFKEFQAERLKEWESTEFAQYRLDDPQITTLVAEVIRPVLRLYRRENCFKLIIIDHPAPVAMNDSGVILMFSTGMLERTTSDDDLLGHAAHEVGHDLFWHRTAQARQILELHSNADAGTPLTERQAYEELFKIELECDAFSALTLAAMGRTPLPTARFHEAVGRDYPNYTRPDLPPADLRVKVIKSVVPAAATRVTPQNSEAFTKLKALVEARVRR